MKTVTFEVPCIAPASLSPVRARITLDENDAEHIFAAERLMRENPFIRNMAVSPQSDPLYLTGEPGVDEEMVRPVSHFNVARQQNASGWLEVFAEVVPVSDGQYCRSEIIGIPTRFADNPVAALDYLAAQYQPRASIPVMAETLYGERLVYDIKANITAADVEHILMAAFFIEANQAAQVDGIEIRPSIPVGLFHPETGEEIASTIATRSQFKVVGTEYVGEELSAIFGIVGEFDRVQFATRNTLSIPLRFDGEPAKAVGWLSARDWADADERTYASMKGG